MNLSDTFYVALCMTVLILGVVYWFWTQNQYIQRKLNLLENIVYEMKTSLSSSGGNDGVPDLSGLAAASELKPAVYPPAPSSVLGEDEDLLHEELTAEAEEPIVAESVDDAIADFAIDNAIAPEGNDDEGTLIDSLQPGGIGSGVKEVVFSDASAKGTVLDSMTLPELKRLAEQRGISGASKMRKQALIDAIRAAPAHNPFELKEATLELS
jgi:hypothetical protein